MISEYLKELEKNNNYVKSISKNNSIIYTDKFYRELKIKLDNNMDSLEAYSSFGFDINILGENRAYAACKRARKISPKSEINYTDGTIPSSEMKFNSLEEELAYLRSRVFVLESIEDCKKKRPDLYQMAITPSKKNK